MKFLHRIVEAIFSRTPFIILTPAMNVGNGSVMLLYGLVRARREGKTLVLLHPYRLPEIFHFNVANSELLDVVSPYRAELPAFLAISAQLALTAFYGSMRALDLVLGKLFGPRAHLHWRFIYPGFGQAKLCKPNEEPAEFRWDVVDQFHWPEELHKPLIVGLRPEKLARAQAVRLEMGMPENAWFVGLHVREAGYHKEPSEFAFRNAAIANYIPAIREITDRGGWVVRLGDETMTPLPPMERVIDYPHTRFKNELMDIYFLSKCRFYIGTSSGILETALLFQRPMVLVNITNPTYIYPRLPGDRGLPKHFYSKSKGRHLSIKEVFNAPPEAEGYWLPGEDFEMRENSPDEIRDVVLEFLEGLEKGASAPTRLQSEVSRLRIEHGRRILDSRLFQNHYDDMENRYHIAARLESSLGFFSRSFVEANWERSVRDDDSAKKTS